MMKPIVSVLLPIFSGEAYLKPAIESFLSQTFGDRELFVGDNASTDRTLLNLKKTAGRSKDLTDIEKLHKLDPFRKNHY
ncbi:MAG TPA: glycosyltransferase [Verrucomicrobiae bacterium]|nr:glycosyltransferase [Verrucomicrobiae bacterium]